MREHTIVSAPPTAAQGPSVRDQIRQDVREAVEQARAEALQARREAAEAGREAAQAAAQAGNAPPGTIFRVGPNGEIQPVEGADVRVAVEDAEAGVSVDPMPPFLFEPRIPREAVTIAIAFFAMIAIIIVGLPLARAYARRLDRRGAVPEGGSATQAQLQQIQTAIDAMAVEVERISENQRFVTRLLTDGPTAEAQRVAAPAAAGAAPLERPLGPARDAR